MIPVIYPQNSSIELPNGMSVRSLIEQVSKNTLDIYNHYQVERVLADFGIKVIGQVETAAELPSEYNGEYGDAYAVGAAAPFSFYIWTRANDVSTTPYWLNIGPLAIVGPQGPAGEGIQGPPGESSQWYYTDSIAYLAGVGKNNDMALTSDGYVYRNTKNKWIRTISIIGPTGEPGPRGEKGSSIVGPRGPQGPAGSPAPIFQVEGVLSSVDQLPDPSSVPRNTAYLIYTGNYYEVYFVTKDSSGQIVWRTVPFSDGISSIIEDNNGQTLARVNWDDKISYPNGGDDAYYVPVISKSGYWSTTGSILLKQPNEEAVQQGGLAFYSNNGHIVCDALPTEYNHLANKEYVDSKIAPNTYEVILTYTDNLEDTNWGTLFARNLTIILNLPYNPTNLLQASGLAPGKTTFNSIYTLLANTLDIDGNVAKVPVSGYVYNNSTRYYPTTATTGSTSGLLSINIDAVAEARDNSGNPYATALKLPNTEQYNKNKIWNYTVRAY